MDKKIDMKTNLTQSINNISKSLVTQIPEVKKEVEVKKEIESERKIATIESQPQRIPEVTGGREEQSVLASKVIRVIKLDHTSLEYHDSHGIPYFNMILKMREKEYTKMFRI
jgi:hypothetical protein